MTVMSMSAKEFSRLDVLMELEARRISVRDACALLRLKRRQVFRLLKDFRARGAASLISKRRGKPGNNRLPQPVRDLVMTLIKERYADFGPTLAAEMLAGCHGRPCANGWSRTVCGWIAAGGFLLFISRATAGSAGAS